MAEASTPGDHLGPFVSLRHRYQVACLHVAAKGAEYPPGGSDPALVALGGGGIRLADGQAAQVLAFAVNQIDGGAQLADQLHYVALFVEVAAAVVLH